ncbi:hypothetical protein D9M68_802610 [compost metagenome]
MIARNRHAVVLPVVDLETACGNDHARADAGGADQPGALVDRVAQVGDALVIELLAGDDADRLGNLLELMLALADGHRAGGVGAAALGGGAQTAGIDAGGAQLQRAAAVGHGLHAEIAALGYP